jgi:hypothetical protein
LDFTKPLRRFSEELAEAQIVVYAVEQSIAGVAIETERAETFDAFTGITGGREYSSDRAGDAIQQARTDSRANYELAYYSAPQKPDGKYHKLRVTCARKDVRLQTKLGFYAVPSAVLPGDLASAHYAPGKPPPVVRSTLPTSDSGLLPRPIRSTRGTCVLKSTSTRRTCWRGPRRILIAGTPSSCSQPTTKG